MKNFKPIKQEKAVISIRIDTKMLEAIDKMALKTDISRNELIIQCINYALENFKDK